MVELSALRVALSEGEPHLRLELPVLRIFRGVSGDQAEVRAGDGQSRRARLRMIQDVARIQAEFQRLGFRDCEDFPHVGVESPGSRQIHGPLSKCAPSSRLRILEHNLTETGIDNRI